MNLIISFKLVLVIVISCILALEVCSAQTFIHIIEYQDGSNCSGQINKVSQFTAGNVYGLLDTQPPYGTIVNYYRYVYNNNVITLYNCTSDSSCGVYTTVWQNMVGPDTCYRGKVLFKVLTDYQPPLPPATFNYYERIPSTYTCATNGDPGIDKAFFVSRPSVCTFADSFAPNNMTTLASPSFPSLSVDLNIRVCDKNQVDNINYGSCNDNTKIYRALAPPTLTISIIVSDISSYGATIQFSSSWVDLFSHVVSLTSTNKGATCTTIRSISSCTINTLSASTLYNVSVAPVGLSYFGALSSSSIQFTTLSILTASDLVVSNISPRSLTVNGSCIGGNPSYPTTMSIATNASSCTAFPCSFTGLNPNTTYQVNVTCNNNGESNTRVQYVKSGLIVQVTPISILSNTADHCSFGWNYTDGDPSLGYTSTVFVDIMGTPVPYCKQINGKECNVTGLTVGNHTVFVRVSNGQDMPEVNQTFWVYPNVTFISPIVQNKTTTSVNITWQSDAVQGTLFDVLEWGTNVKLCQATAINYCTIKGLLPSQTYTYIVQAGLATNNISVTTYRLLDNISPTYVNSAHSIYLNYNTSGGVPNATIYRVWVNNVAYSKCAGPSVTCTVDTNPSTQYTITIYATNDGTTNSITLKVFTPSAMSNLNVVTDQNDTSILVTSSLDGGSLSKLFTTYLNGTSVCSGLELSQCSIPINTYGLYNITVEVIDGQESVSETILEPVYSMPTQSSINQIVPSTYSFYVNWTKSTGGEPGDTSYDVEISLDGSNFRVGCADVSDLFCIVDDLFDNTTYYVRVVVYNSYFDPIYSNKLDTQTLDDTAVLPCLGGCVNGTCEEGVCDCNDGYDGLDCSEHIDPDDDDPDVIPNNSTSEVQIGKSNTTINFKLSTIIERNLAGVAVNTLDLSTLNWTLSAVSDTNITHPNSGKLVRRLSYVYNCTNQTILTPQILLNFTQFLALENQTTDSYPLTFAELPFQVKYGSVKYSLSIEKWLFKSKLNVLEIESSISTQRAGECSSNQIILIKGTTMSNLLVVDGMGNQIYSRLLNRIMLDSQPTQTEFKVKDAQTSVQVINTIPYFKQSVEVDPDLSLLVTSKGVSRPSTCSSDTTSDSKWKTVTIAVVVSVAGAALVTIGSILIYRHNKSNIQILTYKLRQIGR